MKKKLKGLILALTALTFFVILSLGQAETLFWGAPTVNSDNTLLKDLAGFKVYYGSESGYYDNSIDVHNVTSWQLSLPFGDYFIANTAYDTSGNESSFSNEVHLKSGSVKNLRIVANQATEPGRSWCWEWNFSPNIKGYHSIWARTRAELETKINNLSNSFPASGYKFARTDCVALSLPPTWPAPWTVTHIAIIAEDISGNLGEPSYGHYLYGDIEKTHNSGYSYQGTTVGTVDHAWISSFYTVLVPYTANISQFADGTIYNLPPANELELSDLYHTSLKRVDNYDVMKFSYYGFGKRGTD